MRFLASWQVSLLVLICTTSTVVLKSQSDKLAGECGAIDGRCWPQKEFHTLFGLTEQGSGFKAMGDKPGQSFILLQRNRILQLQTVNSLPVRTDVFF